MIVTIHQPDFLPWLGFFDRWRKADLYVVLDDVQFIRRGWQHRDRIKTGQGAAWLTVPVAKKGKYGQSIRDTRINNDESWRIKHLETIRAAYGAAPNFDVVYALIDDVYRNGHEFLMDLNMDLLERFAPWLGAETPVRLASEAKVTTTRTQRLADLVAFFGGDTYLTGTGARNYLDEGAFQRAGITLQWQQFIHPTYGQLHGPFTPNLSVLDWAMMQGPA